MDNYLTSNYDIVLKEAIPFDWDCVGLILGGEGSGKSTFATQTCLYLDPNFDLDMVAWTPQQFGKLVDTAPNGSSILWDEAITGANSKNHYDEVNKMLIEKMTQIRFKNLKIILCLPYLNMFEGYFISRCLFGIYIYAKDFNDRGHGFFYSQPKLEYLYFLQKVKYPYNKSVSYKKAGHNFYFNFNKTLCLPEEEYKKLKEEARLGINTKHSITKSEVLRFILNKNPLATHTEIKNHTGISERQFFRVKKEMGLVK